MITIMMMKVTIMMMIIRTIMIMMAILITFQCLEHSHAPIFLHSAEGAKTTEGGALKVNFVIIIIIDIH